VWGPPGTGKTQVLARAITDLVDAGKRVLLVSSTNIAVDTALLKVIQARRHASGDLVRVGPPHLREVAQDDDVALPRLVATRFRKIEEQRKAIERQLLELRSRQQRLGQLDTALSGYDHNAYLRAVARLAAETRIAPLAERTAELNIKARQARAAVTAAESAFVQANNAWGAIAEARQHLDEATRLERQVEELQLAAASMQTELLQIHAENQRTARALGRLESARLGQRLVTMAERRRLLRRLDRGRRHRTALAEHEQVARTTAELQGSLLKRRIAEHRIHAAPIDADEVVRRLLAVEQARTALAAARSGAETADSAVAHAQDELLAAEAARPTEAERHLVAEAERAGRASQHAERERLKEQARADERDQRLLAQTHERLLDQIDQGRRSAEAEIIGAARLLATTLARSRIHPAIAKASPFDVVLVDEVSAAHTPEVLLAVAKARETAVLLGDFLQLGPILPGKLEKLDRADVRDWLLEDCFSLCGIRTAADAKRNDGCAVLDEQFRFGPDVMDLANRATYQGALRPGTLRPRQDDDPEIVLVDTDGLRGLDIVRRTNPIAGWWLAGSFLARALAQHHREAGAEVGVITPYTEQVDATLEALRDVEADPTLSTEVGTVHRFQGREFDVVIFDLVEDGRGWISSSRLNGRRFERDGARLFNVGLTRTKHRLYLVVSGQAVKHARRGTVLSHIHSMMAEGRVGTVRAADHLTPVGTAPPADETAFGKDLDEALAQYVRVRDIADEHRFYQALREGLQRARHSIWIWAPWTSNRLREVLPLLRDARQRGVEITAFIRSDRDALMRRPENQAWIQQLKSVVSRTIRYHDMHQKIVIIDQRVAWLGSLNTLSHGRTREIMLLHEGRQFTRKLLEHEHAEHFATPPRCGACKATEVELVRSSSAARGLTWYWRCSTAECRWREDVEFDSASRLQQGGIRR
jgi:AAA domain/PLD-like domain